MPDIMVKSSFTSWKVSQNLDLLASVEPLSSSFYCRPEVAQIARDLIGKVLISHIDNRFCAAIIVETEAYSGMNDRACHAHNKKRTPRTETMFLPGGHAYVYLCYGLHHLFNVVTNQEGEPDAVLIRAVQPILGIEGMAERRKMKSVDFRLTKGPACLSQAMGIGRESNAQDLTKKQCIWISENPIPFDPGEIVSSSRIGVDYAGEDALKPWRFLVKGNPWVSVRP